MKCEARARCVVRVGSQGRSGYLYFSDGQIVHAALGGRSGETAALEILSWSHGSWNPCERRWPAQRSIAVAWQALLMRAAQRQDELRQAREPRELEDGNDGANDEDLQLQQAGQRPSGAQLSRGDLGYKADDFEHAVRIDARGHLLSGHGRAEELAALGAYACRLGDLIGDMMGVGALVALDATLLVGRCLVYRGQNAVTVALKPKAHVDLGPIKAQLYL